MTLRVLFIHPDSFEREIAAARLADEGHDVLAVDSGERAIDQFVLERRHAVVVDLELPGRDGAATIESIRWAPGGKDALYVLIGADREQVVRVAERLEVEGVPGGDLDTISRLLLRFVPPRPSEEITRPFPLPVVADESQELDDIDIDVHELEGTRNPGEVRDEARDVERRVVAVERDARLGGDLDEMPFGLVLSRLAEQRASGALVLTSSDTSRRTLTGDAVKKVVFFRNGVPVHIRSNLESECLGQVLLREGWITEEVMNSSLVRVLAGDGRHGTILVSTGAITPQRLRDGLELEQEKKLLELFAWKAGQFQFSDTMRPPNETVALERSLAELVYRGIRERDDVGRVLRRLAPFTDRYIVPTSRHFHGLKRCLDDPASRSLLAGFDGTTTVGTILDAGQPSRAAAARILHAAHCLGAVTFHDSPRPVELDSDDPQEVEISAIARIRSDLFRLWDRLQDGRYAEALDVRPGDGLGAARAVARLESELRAAMETEQLRGEAHSTALEVLAKLPRAALAIGGDYGGSSRPPDPRGQTVSLPMVSPRVPSPPRLPSLSLPIDQSERHAHATPFAETQLADAQDVEAERASSAPDTIAPPRRGSQLPVPSSHPPAPASGNRETAAIEVPDAGSSRPPSMGQTAAPAEEPPTARGEDVEERAQRMLQAERHFRRGRRALGRGDTATALESLTRAVELAPEEGEFLAQLGWARHQSSEEPQERERALDELKLAVRMVPKMHDAQLFHARALRDGGMRAEARNAYARALAADPDSKEALDELRRLE